MHLKARQTIGLIVAASLAATMEEVPPDARFTFAALGLAAGVAALSLMACAALLSARSKAIETLFGDLDQTYRTHKWLGIWALGLAALHGVSVGNPGEVPAAPILASPPLLTWVAGPAALAALLAIVILPRYRRISYSVRSGWHRLSGPLFLIAIVHWLSIPSPIGLGEPAGIWLATVCTLGVAGAGYRLTAYPLRARHRHYRIRRTSGLRLELEPVRRSLTFAPGQFGFIRVHEDGLRHAHPFEIEQADTASDPLQLALTPLGGYTRELGARAEPGLHAEVYGPYGPFERRPATREIWIAWSHGIAPFLTWLDADAGAFENVTLLYVCATVRALPVAEAIQQCATARGAAFAAVPIEMASAEVARHCAEASKWAPADAISVSYSGPPALLGEVRRGLRAAGLPEECLRSETFELGY